MQCIMFYTQCVICALRKRALVFDTEPGKKRKDPNLEYDFENRKVILLLATIK